MMSEQSKFIAGKVLSGRVYPEFFPFASSDTVLNIGSGYGPQAIAYGGHFKQMVGVDITLQRLQHSRILSQTETMGNYIPIMGNVEQLPFPEAYFDKAIAIDIIEHVQSPKAMCGEIRRILKERGRVLITFPTMHDRYTEAISWISRNILRRKSKGTFHDATTEWHPDHHNQEFRIDEWLALVEDCGFRAISSRATTLFPPLHLYGVPRFWFSNEFIHRIDSNLSKSAFLKNYGQGLMVIFEAV
ncbi:MAG: class I SAM-dependent methyltransferase [Chloroflexota bacterium]